MDRPLFCCGWPRRGRGTADTISIAHPGQNCNAGAKKRQPGLGAGCRRGGRGNGYESAPLGEQVSERLTGMLTAPEMVAVRWAVAPLHQVDCPLYDQPDATE